MSQTIIENIENGILKIQINRPEKKNALTHSMYSALASALTAANTDKKVRVVYLTGTKDIFTSGNDITDFAANPPTNKDSPVIQFLYSLASLEKPFVVAANGPAIGVGTTLMLHSDFVILGTNTQLQMPFASLGLCPEAASSYLLPARVGYPKAAEWLLLGNAFTAKEAKEAHLVNEVCEPEHYQARALEIADKITRLPASAIAATRKLLKMSHQEIVKETIDTESAIFYERLNSPEAKEAFTAFFQKRAPNFEPFNF